MDKKASRQVFVCVDYSHEITKIIAAESSAEASKIFLEEFSFSPKEILGPFLKKKVPVIQNIKELKFTNQTRKAIYNDWFVNAFLLKEPDETAYLVFLKRADDKKLPTPKGIVVVPVNDLRFI